MGFWGYLFLAGVVLLWVLSFSNVLAANAFRKIYLMAFGFANLVLTRDTKWKKVPDPDSYPNATLLGTKRVLVIRHGESAWNEVFNKGFGPSFFVRLVKAIIKECLLLVTTDSVFFDSPLNRDGVEQSRSVVSFLRNPGESALAVPEIASAVEILSGGGRERSVICCSNLRRCIETTVIAFQERLHKTGENVHVLSSLQEISRNIDCLALGPKNQLADLHVVQDELKEPFNNYDVSEQWGNKPILGMNGYDRMRDFCDWIFARDESVIVAGGHSLYWRHFFKTFTPATSSHPAKTSKLKNCGIVSFNLQRLSVMEGDKQRLVYRVDPDSICPVYLGFAEPKKKKTE